MPIQITNFKTWTQIVNGETFGTATGTFQQSAVNASVGKYLKTEITISVSWEATSVASNTYDILGNEVTQSANLDNWIDEGFAVGDTIDFYDNAGVSTIFSRTIVYIEEYRIVFSGASVATNSYPDATIHGNNQITEFEFNYDFNTNAETPDYLARGSENKFRWIVTGMSGGGGYVSGVWGDNYTNEKYGSFRAQVSTVTAYVQTLTIQHEFLIPFYIDGELSNIQNFVKPDYLSPANATIEYRFLAKIRSDLDNTNDLKQVESDYVSNSIGWFNETFTTGVNQGYTVSNLVYTNNATALAVDGILNDNVTDISFRINSSTSSLVTTQPLVIKVCKLPSAGEYTSKTDTFSTIWIYDQKYITVDAAPASSDFIENVDVDLFSASRIDIDFQINYSAGQKALINENDAYLILVEIGNDVIIVDAENYVVNTDVTGLVTITNFGMYALNDDLTGSGWTELYAKVEDNILVKFDLNLNIDDGAVLKDFEVGLYARNITTGDYFYLDKYVNNFESVVVSGGVQQISLNDTRGFALKSGDEFNKMTVTTGSYSSPLQTYEMQCGLKVAWQNYLKNANANAIFYDNTDLNNGLNFNTSNYSGISGYDIVVGIVVVVSDGSVDTTYGFWSPTIDVNDYEDDSDSLQTFAATGFVTKKQDNTVITPNYSGTENTKLEVTFNPDSAIDPTDDIEGAIYLYEYRNGLLNNSFQINSVNNPLTINNPLIPKTGQTKLLVTNNSTTVLMECQLDYTQLSTAFGFTYTISGRVYNTSLSGNNKLMEDGTIKRMEDGTAKNLD